MPSRSLWFGLAASALVTVSCLLVAQALGTSPQLAQARADFARPAAWRGAESRITDDPVWQLGQRLFFEPQLSGAATMSCANCHQPDRSWTDGNPRAVGADGQRLAFRAPTLLNVGQIERYGWIGRFHDIEAVTFFAMTSPKNMNASPQQVVARLRSDTRYGAAFRTAFPDGEITKQHIGAALDRYVRSIVSDEAPFDRWLAGDRGAIGVEAVRGFDLFRGKARCGECHSGWTFTDGSFHDTGLSVDDGPGRGELFPSSIKLQHAFKTPTLRNVAVRPPYMHDGSIASLEAVIDHYAKGGLDRPSRAEDVHPITLTAQEKKDLLEFLKTLTSGTTFVGE